jgi:hypothetical protein
MIPSALANIIITGIIFVIGQQFGFVISQGSYLSLTKAGYIYFIATAFLITVPTVWIMLAVINKRSRNFNLVEPQPLAMRRTVRTDPKTEAVPTSNTQ